MGKTVTLTLAIEDARLLRTLLDEALRPAKPQYTRVSGETFKDIFNALANSGEEFNVVFEKLDGSWREMRARMTGPVEYSYSTRQSFARVVDLDILRRNGEGGDRKIVLNRVKRLEVDGFTFVSYVQ